MLFLNITIIILCDTFLINGYAVLPPLVILSNFHKGLQDNIRALLIHRIQSPQIYIIQVFHRFLREHFHQAPNPQYVVINLPFFFTTYFIARTKQYRPNIWAMVL